MTFSITRTCQLTKPHNFVTITANNTAEMIGLESKYDRLECDEFRFLKEIPGIDIDIAFKISFIPEFVEALKDFDGKLNSETVYEVLKTVSNQMIHDGTMYKNAKRIMNKISLSIKNNSILWNTTPSYLLPHNDKLGFLYKKTEKIRPVAISAIALCPEFTKAICSYEKDLNDDSIYEILKSVSNELYRNNNLYKTARDVMNSVSKSVKGYPSAWREQ